MFGRARLLLPVLFLLAVPARGFGASDEAKAKATYEHARRLFYSLKGSPQKQRFRHHWIKVIAAFGEVNANYPDSSLAPAALYTSAELWSDLHKVSLRASDLDQALAAYEELEQRYSASTLADDALWQEAEIYLKRRVDRAAAAMAVDGILKRHPKGDMAKRARSASRALADVMPKPGAQPSTAPESGSGPLAGPMKGRRDEGGPIPKLQDVKHWSNPVYSRVAVYLTGPATVRTAELAANEGAGQPARIYADLKPATLAAGLVGSEAVEDDVVAQLRLSQHTADTVRLVFDLKTAKLAVHHRVMVLENPYRVVVDLYTGDEAPNADEKVWVARRKKVVLDPGHGGHDPGAHSKNGVLEKDVVLAIAKQIKVDLEKSGIDAVLTRDSDRFISLEERTAIANRAGADAFVSIHANSHRSPTASGIETYYLDTTDDRYALRLAARENSTKEEQVSDVQLALADLATKVNTRSSQALAKRIQRGLLDAARPFNKSVRNLGVKSSLFYVLLGARMPAVLVETSFISHPKEAKLLASARYQAALAESIADAVVAHFATPMVAARP